VIELVEWARHIDDEIVVERDGVAALAPQPTVIELVRDLLAGVEAEDGVLVNVPRSKEALWNMT
jgi:hypothetical protein